MWNTLLIMWNNEFRKSIKSNRRTIGDGTFVVYFHCYFVMDLEHSLGLRDPIIHSRSIITISGWQKCASAMNLATLKLERASPSTCHSV